MREDLAAGEIQEDNFQVGQFVQDPPDLVEGEFLPDVLPAGTANVYFEAAAVIVTLILVGRWFEARARGRTSQAIRRLMTEREPFYRTADLSVPTDGLSPAKIAARILDGWKKIQS